MGSEKGKITRQFTKELLDLLTIRDNAKILGNYDKLTSKTKIKYICSCGNEGSKSFAVIPEYKMLCRKCINKVMLEKTKITNLERYNCEDPNQLPSMKEKIKNIFVEKYGVDSPMKTEVVKNKMKNTFIENYGVENPFQNEEIKEKIKNTFIQKYGVEHALQYKEFQDKFKTTLKNRYDVEVPYHSEIFKEKGRMTCLEKYGVEYGTQSEIIREQIKKTCLEKYGVESPSQSKEIQEKIQRNAKKYKKYTMPSGEIRLVQGYEPFALKQLLELYTEEQIKTSRKDIPRIKYTYNDKTKYYFPDIYIPHVNKLIEIKSTWTYSSENDNIDLKANASIDSGYDYEIWVYNNKGELIKIAKN